LLYKIWTVIFLRSWLYPYRCTYILISVSGNKWCVNIFRCKTVYLLNKHVATHSDVKVHQCDVCGKQFRESSTLRLHTRIHTGAMPYRCEFCGRQFRFQGVYVVSINFHVILVQSLHQIHKHIMVRSCLTVCSLVSFLKPYNWFKLSLE